VPPDFLGGKEPRLGGVPGRRSRIQQKRQRGGERENQHRRGEAEVECPPTHPEHERESQRDELVNSRDTEKQPVVPALVSDPEPLLQDARWHAAAKEPPLEIEVGREVGVRAYDVRQSTAFGVEDDERDIGQEVEQKAPPPTNGQRRGEEQERVAVRRQAEIEDADRDREDEEGHSGRQRNRRRVQISARWTPALAALAALLAFGTRVVFWGAPLTADEGGYAQIARLWDSGVALYDGAWVDRPQGLLLVYRGILEVGGGSTESLRITAAAVAMLIVVATVVVAVRLTGTIEAIAAGLLLATFAASPFIESFTLSGELLASFPAVLSLLAFTVYLQGRRVAWLVAAGLLTGCAVMIKQSAFDAGLAAVMFLVLTERRRAISTSSIFVLTALVPAAIALSTAPHVHDWWEAVVAYRLEGDSLMTGSAIHRLELFADSVPAAAKGLGVLALLAAIGWRSSPLLVRLWLGAAVVGVLGGGNFHTHYYIQLAAPLSILAGVGLRQLLVERRRLAAAVCGAAALVTLVLTAPLWFAGGSAQAHAIWPKDRRLVHSEAVALYVRTHTSPNERIFVLWAGADIYYLADRRPALPYMWYRNLESIDGAIASARRLLAARRPALVVLAHQPDAIDPSGATGLIVRRKYRLAAFVEGVPVLEVRPSAYGTQS
jgi:Dolichyl-phosphate-mannose-protein mannosyltransferase